MPLSGNRQFNDTDSRLSKSIRAIGPLFAWWPEYRKSKVGVIGLIMVGIFIFAIILAPYIATHDPTFKDRDFMWKAPSFSHFFGTTAQGKDVFSQLLHSGQISLMIGVAAAGAVTAMGTIIGLIAGYFGGIVDEILTRIADILLVLPRLPLMLVLAAYLGPGMSTIVFVVVILGWTRIARQVRAQVMSCKQHTYVERAKSIGAGNFHIIWNHILPNVAGVVIANFVLECVTVIMLEAGLSFLGFGDPLHQSWGMMLFNAQNEGAFLFGAWWQWLPPGACIAVLGIAFSFIGNTLNDRFVLRLKNIKGGA
ncbi:MAG: ABC transporter permease [Chloroflexi bacterium]|nr:ABC transporter permease [Chloroflexota bacterium]MBT7290397.1 ABC transporter permease [Chloroflexota bacterium]